MSDESTSPDEAAPEDPRAPWRPPGWTPPDSPETGSDDVPARRLTPPELIWSPSSLRATASEPPAPPVTEPTDVPTGALDIAVTLTVEPRRRRPRRPGLRTVGVAVGVAALVGVPTAGVLYLRAAGGTGDVLVGRAVPGGAAVYASLRLDPSLSTKQHLRDLLDR